MTPTRLVVRDAADLLSALRSSDANVRAAALRAICQDPAGALAFGVADGTDVLDELIDQVRRMESADEEWEVLVRVVAEFVEPRAAACLFEALPRAESTRVIVALLRRLAGEEPEPHLAPLRTALWRDDRPERAQAAAELMAGAAGLTAEEQVRVSVLAGPDAPDAPWREETEAAWLSELHGRFAEAARVRLEDLGEPAYLALAAHWERLASDTQRWLLEWGARCHPAAAARLASNLRPVPRHLLTAALNALAGGVEEALRPDLDLYLRDEEPPVRAAMPLRRSVLPWCSAAAREPPCTRSRHSQRSSVTRTGRSAPRPLRA
jgi:hypothetical protein